MRKHIKGDTIVVQPLHWLHVNTLSRFFHSCDAGLHVNFSPGDLSDWNPDDPPHYFGIFVGSTLVGLATIGADEEKGNVDGTVGLLSDVYIAPNERNKGYGTVLVKSVLSIAQDNGYTQVNIEVLDPELLDWYSQLGFGRTSDFTATFRIHD